MSIDLSLLRSVRRLLIEAELEPVQGKRFQPTGFPDLGPATFQAGDTACLLLESAQSMANRLEETIWDKSNNTVVDDLEGISYVVVNDESEEFLTSSIVESHRLNSPYILESKDKAFHNQLREECSVMEKGPIDRKALANTLLKYDINALIHGVFLAKQEFAGGRLRVARALSSFIEAEQVQVAASGGVKNDHVDPQGDTKKGFGNVPFHREEFTAAKITAYFNVDLQQIRSYGLGEDVENLLTLLSLYKIRALLDGDLRLRTACDLQLKQDEVSATKPNGFVLPNLGLITNSLKNAIEKCKSEMTVNTVVYKK
ncbi:type I-G CRISPR-associated RAMP protein Csb1/Cas7g [Rhodopirellula halodulae]|uniref:type I-G CRISPR-associated RAMP protein Csb1/Cas7g n=1 Tax=Rhodopirellula halodulae TaxID=2894198 RepID=UPI001E2A5A5A|nr:type I-U CRISPR-associated RAMP protein Csb1/Cas7u [Rhodopirellula sp. JC737]MCC9656849.1 type I-U CRISPR-associated RAMP protein Csb1/Cas7u [Rhodopirellula sp. JC737]